MRANQLRLLLALIALTSFSGARGPGLQITWHVEGEPIEGSKRFISQEVHGKKVHFHRLPTITNRHIEAFYPFPAENGNNWGAAFKLDNFGYKELLLLSSTSQGKLLGSAINGAPIDVVRIDRAKEDQFIVIWQGLTDEIILKLAKKYPQLGASVVDQIQPSKKKKKGWWPFKKKRVPVEE